MVERKGSVVMAALLCSFCYGSAVYWNRSIDALQFTNVRHISKKPKCNAGGLSCSGALAQQRSKGESGHFILSLLEWNATGYFPPMLTPSSIPHSSLCSQLLFA